jgi:hypothetical protein
MKIPTQPQMRFLGKFRGAYRQVVREPGDLLFVAPAAGTQHREVDQHVQDESSRKR